MYNIYTYKCMYKSYVCDLQTCIYKFINFVLFILELKVKLYVIICVAQFCNNKSVFSFCLIYNKCINIDLYQCM